MAKAIQDTTALGGTSSPNNDAEVLIAAGAPYVATVRLEGTSAILMHRWSNEDVAAKSAAAKGSAAKKTDNVEAYVWRCEDGTIGIPGEYLRMSIVNAGRSRPDPRSPRKSSMDLLKAAIVPLTEIATLGCDSWDYLDSRRVAVQRNAVTRVRPAFLAGWQAEVRLLCNLPEYVPPADLLDVITLAGRLVGLGDFRPTYGRFQVIRYEVGLE